MLFVDYIDPSDLNHAIARGWVGSQTCGAETIWNYRNRAVTDKVAWDSPAVRRCRGLIVRSGEVIARGWEKFFEHDDKHADIFDLDEPVEVTEKVDGSLGILYRRRDGSPAIATRGSLDGRHAEHAQRILGSLEVDWPLGISPMVEIIAPDMRVLLDYGDRETLVLLGGVSIETGDYLGPDDMRATMTWSGEVAQIHPYRSVREVLQLPPRPGHEGYVVRALDRPALLKVKQSDYVFRHRLLTYDPRGIWLLMGEGESLEAIVGSIPERLHEWARGVYTELDAAVRADMSAAQHVLEAVQREHGSDAERKQYAFAARDDHRANPSDVFALLDGRDPYATILKRHRPAVAP